MKNRVLLLLLIILLPETISGQLGVSKPAWVSQKPIAPPRSYFYYNVSMGEGNNLDKAYENALKNVVKDVWLKNGGRITTEDGTNSITLEDFSMKLPINPVCRYWLQLYSPSRIRMYVLWQIADDANVYPKWEDFNQCSE